MREVKKSKIIYLTVFGLLALACIWAFVASSMITRNFKKEIVEQKNSNQKVKIDNLIIIETRENVKSWELCADSGYYNSGEKEAVLTDIIGNFYDNNKVSISFKAKEASFNDETKRIVLNKDAVVIYEDGTFIHANEFEWEGATKHITAKGNIKIVKPNEAVITGETATLSNQMTDFQISGGTVTKLFGEGRNIK